MNDPYRLTSPGYHLQPSAKMVQGRSAAILLTGGSDDVFPEPPNVQNESNHDETPIPDHAIHQRHGGRE